MHLFVSFILRAISIFIKDRVVHTSAGLQEFDAVLMNNLTNTVDVAPVNTSQYVSNVEPGNFLDLTLHKAAASIQTFGLFLYFICFNKPDEIPNRFDRWYSFHYMEGSDSSSA